MEIIKRGTKPEDARHIGTCANCKTEVEFARSEGVVTHDQRDGSFVSVDCPVCVYKIRSDL